MNLLQPSDLYDYQRECVTHMLQHSDAMLWLQMGLGKTPISLTVTVDRMKAGTVKKTLIFGPLRVIQSVWHREAKKWSHTRHLRFSIIHGNQHQRRRALFAEADVYLCNYENMNWLANELVHYFLSQNRPIPFQQIIYDEVSKMKNSTTLRMAGGKRDRVDKFGKEYAIKVVGWRRLINQFKYRIGLTGTPASNGYEDLHGQFLAVDGGKRLGEYVTGFRDRYFVSDYMGWGFTPTPEGKQLIEQQIGDITKKMDAKDYLDMPEVKVINVMVDLTPKARKAYNEVEEEMFTMLDNGTEIEVFSRSSVSNKCLQFANGSPYKEAGSLEWEPLHDVKLKALEDILEEAGGQPVLCSYTFKSDAERIMKKFAKYRPVNMTEQKSSMTGKIIDDWNSGKIKLLIGHPACLHPKTKVLTQYRGWVNLIDVRKDELVYDGVEFVSHDGCSFSGVTDVIDKFGITLTLNHKLLINDEWVEAKDVRDSQDTREEALYQYQGDDKYLSKMFTMRHSVRDTSSKCYETQQTQAEVLSTLHQGHVSQHDSYSHMANMAGYETPDERPDGLQLRRSWYRNVQKLVKFQKLLQGYVTRILGRLDHRASRCEQGLQQRELCVGYQYATAVQQTQQSDGYLQGRVDTLSGTVSQVRVQQNDVVNATEQGNDRRRSSGVSKELNLRQEAVYDLVNCGPRNRFLIKNDDGEVFISHNSMGHGIDGLQQSGSIVVWYGVNWSLELYEQMNGRIDRNGQKQPVSVIRILCKDTIDLAVADAISRKFDDQEGLKSALQRYRDGITDNNLTVNFF